MKRLFKPEAFLFLLILSLCYGGSGGAHEPIRILAIILSPFALSKLGKPSYIFIKPIAVFFVCWLLYMVLSLLWSLDSTRGLNEIVYYIIHFLLFIEILVFAKQSSNRLDIISWGWLFAFLLTSIVAVWEIRTGHHLASALQEKEYASTGEQSVRIYFAAANFGNYNTYCTFICFALPFFFYRIMQRKVISRILGVVAITLSIVIIFLNASRGALLSLVIMTGIFLWFNLKSKGKNSKSILFVLSMALLFLFYYYGSQIMSHILFRLDNSDGFEDTKRMGIWTDALELFFSTGGLGVGVGSLGESMRRIHHTVTHNVFFELLVQFGMVITVIITWFFTKIFLRFPRCPFKLVKILGYCAFLAFPFYSIIDSSYLLKPQIWVLVASLYVFSNYKKDKELGIDKWE